MTLSVVSDANGSSGSLKIGAQDRLVLNSDGTVSFGASPVPADISSLKGTVMAQFGAKLASNGYQKLPSGFIIQWGGVTTNVTATTLTTFPITFPNTCLRILVSPKGSDAPRCSTCFGETTMLFYTDSWVTTTGARSANENIWIAIGY